MTAAISASCPFCGSTDVEEVAAWGGQLITSQARCRACNSYFEAVRDVFTRLRTGGGEDRRP